MDEMKTQKISARSIENVIVHPLLLLGILDQYNRVARDAKKRVVGVLLGDSFNETFDVTNSCAIPLRDLFNLLPNLNVNNLIKAFSGRGTIISVTANDMRLVIYLPSLIWSVIALHYLINNKVLNKEDENPEDSKPVAVPTAAGS